MARRLWNRALTTQGTPVSLYLKARGITVAPPSSIQFLPRAKHSITGLFLPCMVAAVSHWPTNEIVGVHRTFLAETGYSKAQITAPKMALGTLSSGAVRLARATDVLGLAEGIETGLSAMQLFGDPVWSACGSNIASVIIPDTVNQVIIYADNGEAGERIADKAAKMHYRKRRKLTIVRPIDGFGDFNNYLVAQAQGMAT